MARRSQAAEKACLRLRPERPAKGACRGNPGRASWNAAAGREGSRLGRGADAPPHGEWESPGLGFRALLAFPLPWFLRAAPGVAGGYAPVCVSLPL